MPRNISPLTSLRFFAASLVLWHHSVRIFLPGFSVRRLYPLYFVVLVLTMPKLLAAEVERHGMRIGLTKTAEIFAANIVMVQGWYASRLLRINVPTWSLCGEVFFYLCFPLLGVLLWQLRGPRLWMTALALYAGGQLLVWGMRPHLSLEMALSLPPLHLSTFALGILLARWQTLRNGRKNKAAVPAWQVNLVLALSVGGVLLSVPLIPFFGVPAPYNNGLLAPLFAGFIWALTATPTPLSRWLCGQWLVALGNSSYALYLIHTPILTLFLHFQWVTHRFYPLYLALCVGLSLLSFHYFETPARLWLLERFHALAAKQIPEPVDAPSRQHRCEGEACDADDQLPAERSARLGIAFKAASTARMKNSIIGN